MIQIARFAVLLIVTCSLSEEQKLNLLIIVPYPQPQLAPFFRPSISDGHALHLAAELAADLANRTTNILSGYQLELLQGDGGCSVSFRAIDSFVVPLLNVSQIVGVVGPACSLSASAVSALSGRSEIALINIHLSGTQRLNDRALYPYSFGILDSAELLVKAMVSMIEVANWENVAIFYDASRLYFLSLVQAINEESLEFKTYSQVDISAANLSPFHSIENKFRIVFILVDTDLLNRLLCIAYHHDYILPVYQYVLIVDSLEEIAPVLVEDELSLRCSVKQLRKAINGSLLIRHQLERPDSEYLTESGISLQTFRKMYRERIEAFNVNKRDNYTIEGSDFAVPFFDAVWSFIMTLNASMNTIDLSSYHYGQQNVTDKIREKLLGLDFEGLSGRVRFNSVTGRVQQNASIFIVDEEAMATKFAYYSRENGILPVTSKNYTYTSDQFDRAIRTVPQPLVYILLVAVFLGLFLTLLLNVLTCVYRKENSVKASSVKLSQVAFIGCYVHALSIVFAVVIYGASDRVHPHVVCIFQHLLDFSISLGLTLLFGAICVRVWRLYRIFIHFNNPGRLSDGFLLIILLMVIIIDLMFTIPAFFVDKYSPDDEVVVDNSGSIVTVILQCKRKHFVLWFTGSLIVSAVLLFAIFALVILTRKIPQKNFRTRSTLYLAYVLAGIIPFTLGIYFVLNSLNGYVYTVLRFVTLCVLILCLNFISCAMLFFPPLLPILKRILQSQLPHK